MDRRIPLLNTSHLETRKKFAVDMLKKDVSYFDKVLWSDDTKIELFGNNYNSKVFFIWSWRTQCNKKKDELKDKCLCSFVRILGIRKSLDVSATQ